LNQGVELIFPATLVAPESGLPARNLANGDGREELLEMGDRPSHPEAERDFRMPFEGARRQAELEK
jgi:hypothetical protein